MLKQLLPNFFRCPKCKHYMEVVPGELDPNLRTADGKEISKPAQEHFSQCRVRCFNCHENFCTQCKAAPYHLGYNCEQWDIQKKLDKCRFCQEMMNDVPLSDKPAFKHVCRNEACIKLCEKTCEKVKNCGHPCNGFKEEAACMPCLHQDCVKQNDVPTLGINDDTYCPFCFTECLRYGPCVQLKCKHIFHADCISEKIKRKWDPTQPINCNFIDCPACN